VSISPFLTVEDVMARYSVSKRTVHERVRRREIPHFRRSGTRRVFFREDELDAYDNGAELEAIELHGVGRLVRPKK
jgi:excisionase family DNA binding protein